MRRSSEQCEPPAGGKPVRPYILQNFSSLQLVATEGPPDDLDGAHDPEGKDGDPEKAVDAENYEEFRTKVRPGPVEPSAIDRDHHECTGHSVYRSWCAACVEGRGRAQPHHAQDHSQDTTPVLSWD